MNDVDVYVPFETAKQLKERGFESVLYSHYTNEGRLVISEYKAQWINPAPTQGQALEWLRQHNVYTSLYVKPNEEGKTAWQFEFYNKDLDLLATDSGLSITDYNKCVDFAISYAVRFLIR